VAWETLPISPTVFQFGNVPHIVDAGGTLVAVGIHQEPLPSGEFEVGAEESVVWTSTDGATWQEVANLGQEFWVGSVAADENVIVALGGLRSQPGNVMMRSEDGGRTWTAVDLPDGLPQSLFQVVAGNGRFVAAGDEAVITSTDGQTWTEATSDSTVVDEVNGLWALPEGFMVSHVHRQDGGLVQQCYAAGLTPAQPQPSGRDELIDEPTDAPTVGPVPTDRCESIPANGGTSISADGLEWKRGPDLPMPGNGGQPNRYLVAGLGDSLVAADDTHGASIWYSPLELFLTSD
jgi:hypothetical protein